MDEDEVVAPGARRGVLIVAVVGVLAAAVVAAFVAGRVAGDDEPSETAAVRDTATVTFRQIAPSATFDGELVFADDFLVVARIAPPPDDEEDAEAAPAPGPGGVDTVPTPTPTPSATITDIPPPGAVIQPGEVLFEADSRPVVLLPGAEPASRTLAAGIPDGPDVAQLEAWLAAEGFDPQATMTVDESFTDATTEVVAEWQRALGVEPTGEVALGDVVFAPGALRVVGTAPPFEIGNETVVVVEGTTVNDLTPVLSVSSVNREVIFEIGAEDRPSVADGDVVEVELPDGTKVAATVSTIRASSVDDGGFTVTATVDAPGLPDADRTPVEVTVIGETVEGLFVPAGAIVSRDLGGYAVEVVSPSGRSAFVTVEVGVVAGREVQVISPVVGEGTVVIAP